MATPEDAVLLAKEWESSQRLAQHPVVLVPVSAAAALDPATLTPRNLNQLGKRDIKEYLRTAAAVEKDPWSLHRAAS